MTVKIRTHINAFHELFSFIFFMKTRTSSWVSYACDEAPLGPECIVLQPESLLFFGVCEELPKDVAGAATVGVTEPTGVTMTEDESTDVDESNEFIDIVDLK